MASGLLASLKDVQPLLTFVAGALLTHIIQWRQRANDQGRAWAIKQAEELYNPLLEMTTREMWSVDHRDGWTGRDYDAWRKMFTDEVRSLVHTKAHLASPTLIRSTRALRTKIEDIKVAWEFDADNVNEVEWLERPIQDFITAVHSDMNDLRQQVWPYSPTRWMRDAWFRMGLHGNKKLR